MEVVIGLILLVAFLYAFGGFGKPSAARNKRKISSLEKEMATLQTAIRRIEIQLDELRRRAD